MAEKAEKRPNALLDFSAPTKRFLIFVAVISWAIPLSGYVVQQKVARPQVTLATYHGTRGPWVGVRGPDGSWTHSDTQPTYTFRVGQAVVWEGWTDVADHTTISGEATLVCDSLPIIAEDYHTYANEKREGWKAFGLHIPNGAPVGECGVRRHIEYTGANGLHEEIDHPVIHLRIIP